MSPFPFRTCNCALLPLEGCMGLGELLSRVKIRIGSLYPESLLPLSNHSMGGITITWNSDTMSYLSRMWVLYPIRILHSMSIPVHIVLVSGAVDVLFQVLCECAALNPDPHGAGTTSLPLIRNCLGKVVSEMGRPREMLHQFVL